MTSTQPQGYTYVPLELMSHADVWLVTHRGKKVRTSTGVESKPRYHYVAVVQPPREWKTDKSPWRTQLRHCPIETIEERIACEKLYRILLLMNRRDFSMHMESNAGAKLLWIRRICNLNSFEPAEEIS